MSVGTQWMNFVEQRIQLSENTTRFTAVKNQFHTLCPPDQIKATRVSRMCEVYSVGGEITLPRPVWFVSRFSPLLDGIV